MSFSTEVKAEIAQIELNECCKKAQLSALIQLCATLSISSGGLTLVVKTENATVAKRIYVLVQEVFGVETQLSIIRKLNLKKNNVYSLRIMNKAKEILEGLGLYSSRGLLDKPLKKVVSKDCCQRAYLAGAFMACGSVNSPVKSNYHLEIKTTSEAHAEFIIELLSEYNINAKYLERRGHFVVYVKVAEKIGDFLACISAEEARFKFEDIRISRDFTNTLIRTMNCDVANEMKSQKMAREQLEDIETIKSKISYLSDKLREAIEIRMEFPEASLKELCIEYEKKHNVEISKSGLKHRFTKIHELAEKERNLNND